MTRLTTAGLLVLIATAACAQPKVFWASDPVGPDDSVIAIGDGFGDAVRAAGMFRGSHDGLAAEALDGPDDAFIIGGDAQVIEHLGVARSFVHALDHGFAGDDGEGFAWETGGRVSGGDDTHDS